MLFEIIVLPPWNNIFTHPVSDKIVRLLNDLRSKKHVLAQHLGRMMLKRDDVALVYLYFILQWRATLNYTHITIQ